MRVDRSFEKNNGGGRAAGGAAAGCLGPLQVLIAAGQTTVWWLKRGLGCREVADAEAQCAEPVFGLYSR